MKKITSKQEERQALEKIMNIIEDMGENSYLQMSFKGFYDLAENNINDDTAINYLDIIQNRNNEINQLKFEKEQLIKQIQIKDNEIKDLKNKIENDKKWNYENLMEVRKNLDDAMYTIEDKLGIF